MIRHVSSPRKTKAASKVVLGMALLLLGMLVWAQQTDNYELRAVPAPGKVVIDGKLNDWDLSGEIMSCYDLSRLGETYSVRTAAMYDASYLYFSFRFKDRTPMANRFRPVVEAADVWRGDAVQIRMKSDRVVHVTCWYYTDEKQPAMSIHYGMWEKTDPDYADLPDALAAGAKAAFVRDADGQGYRVEIALPWKLITRDGRALKAGDEMLLGLEFLWGDASGRNWPAHVSQTSSTLSIRSVPSSGRTPRHGASCASPITATCLLR